MAAAQVDSSEAGAAEIFRNRRLEGIDIFDPNIGKALDSEQVTLIPVQHGA